MRALRKIDALSVFFVFSIGLILLLYKYDLIDLSEFELSNKTTVDFNNNVVYDKDERIIGVLNPVFNIYYSEDGGETFKSSNGRLDLGKIQNKENTNIPTSYNWKAPSFYLPEVKSVACFIKNKNSLEVSPIYFFTDVSSYQSELPIINLSIKHSDMFDEFKGVHILGADSWQEDGFFKAWWEREANFTNRGMDSERQVNMQFFIKGELLLDQNMGLRIGGNATRGFPQKSLKLYARKNYGSEIIKNCFLETGVDKYKSLVLRTSGNDNVKTLFADLLMHSLAYGTNVLTQNGQATELFINGRYWGLYNLRERIDCSLLAKKMGGKEKNVTILEGGNAELKEGESKDQKEFTQLVADIKSKESIGLSDIKNLEEKINISSFIDYIIFETFFANLDWPTNNSLVCKLKGEKWTWVLNDLDFSLAYPGKDHVNQNMFSFLSDKTDVHSSLFNKLIEVEEFKRSYEQRVLELFESNLSNGNITSTYEELKSSIGPAMPQQIKRWRSIPSLSDWESNCKDNLNFLLERKTIYLNHLKEL